MPKRNGASNVVVRIRDKRLGHPGKRWPTRHRQRPSIRRRVG